MQLNSEIVPKIAETESNTLSPAVGRKKFIHALDQSSQIQISHPLFTEKQEFYEKARNQKGQIEYNLQGRHVLSDHIDTIGSGKDCLFLVVT